MLISSEGSGGFIAGGARTGRFSGVKNPGIGVSLQVNNLQ
jgi:hypothetical protein